MPKEIIVTPDAWYLRISDTLFVGANGETVGKHEAIAFPSQRSAWMFRLDAFGKASKIEIHHHKGRTYEVNKVN